MEVVIFDLETTGLSPYQDEIIQIAGIRMKAGRILETETFATFVKPKRRISSFISSYTGITDAHVRDAPSSKEAVSWFSKYVGDAVLIAHNGQRFDMPFIRETCRREGLPTRNVGFVDSMALSRRLWGGRGGHGLDNVMQRLALTKPESRRHDARGDVEILAEAVKQMWTLLGADYQKCPVSAGSGVVAQ
ncbi:MAG TPA: 3'-5' exonuclease [Candidatus Methylacidiphilales bacterium]